MRKYNKTICVIGLGYIGLPTAALLASKGYLINGVDINQNTVDVINNGDIHIVEPDLDQYVAEAVKNRHLKAFIKPQVSDIYIICVPTPFYSDKEIPSPNIEFIVNATKSITPLIKPGDMIILESTSPVGTTEKIAEIFSEGGIDTQSISIAYCPERVLPGKIMIELISNDRIVGGLNKLSTQKVADFYKTFVDGDVLECSAKTAEMCKLAENSFRDINIAFANELSIVCDTHDIDAWELIRLANHHPRVEILQPGTGVGGHCIAVDPWFLVSGDLENARLTKLARQVNDFKPNWVVQKIMSQVNSLIENGIASPKVVCLGLAFKPDIDDLRESPAVQVVQDLIDLNVNVLSVEPNIQNHDNFKLCSLKDALDADLMVILVKHNEFITKKNKKKLLGTNILDFCGALA
jgi:UDP-N-acetyl-D-mannosaminuronic acid dehydrogenase